MEIAALVGPAAADAALLGIQSRIVVALHFSRLGPLGEGGLGQAHVHGLALMRSRAVVAYSSFNTCMAAWAASGAADDPELVYRGY